MQEKKIQHVYIIGSKGIPAKYGGFETFVEKLTENQVHTNIQYHVACIDENSAKSNITDSHFEYNGADCFNLSVPSIGPAKAVYYDIKALNYAIQLSKKNEAKNPIFYVLACRIGPFISYMKRKIKRVNGKLLINPDGHEWLRQKWSMPVRKYWKLSEKMMIKSADLLICDSKNIEQYIQKEYKAYKPKTKYIAYGTDTSNSTFHSDDDIIRSWYEEKNVTENHYYLIVGRFVPENNFEIMIREFMESKTDKDLVIITNVEKNKFYEDLKKTTMFEMDARVKFVGTIYNQEHLKYIRAHAYAYLHGHEVGGTNPSLLEALFYTKINLLLDVGFNKEVALDSAIYWSKDNLHQIINEVEQFASSDIDELNKLSTFQIEDRFRWDRIVNLYEDEFLNF